MAVRHLHGLDSKHELQEEFLYRDTRPAYVKFLDWCKTPANMAMLLVGFASGAFIFPSLSDYIFIVSVIFFLCSFKVKESCPLKMPIQSGLYDDNQPHPATGAPTKAKGIFYLGNEIKTGKEVWLTNDDCRQHFLVIGTTGAGKTETLLGFAANSLLWGSGLLFCDGKGDVSVFAKLYALTRRFGREDDLLVLNFMTGNADLGASGGKIKSNTLNPFSTGSSDSLTQMVVSLMDEAGGDGALWKGRATAMLTGVMRALCWLRDNGIVDLNVGEIRNFMNLDRVIDLADASKYPEMPPEIRGSVKAYLKSLPGFNEEAGYKQGTTTRDQHGYLEMQFTKILGSLADVYGHIFKTEYGEVDMTDVVLNRRILFVMLPALEKSGDELANLGKIVVANLKGMMGSALGSNIEGTWYDVVENRQTTSTSPFMAILDEVGYYAVDGLALMAAQARSLGFSMVYASQDIPAMERRNEKEAASIIANTNTKLFMRTEEVEKSGKLAVEAAGKAVKAQVSGYQGKVSEMGVGGYVGSNEARLELVDRLSFRDLKQQTEGEAHILYQDKVIRARSFYANPEGAIDTSTLKLRANHFIKVVPPDLDDLAAEERLPEIMKKLVDPAFVKDINERAKKAQAAASNEMVDEIAVAARIATNMEEGKRNPMEAGCGAVGAVAEVMSHNINAFQEHIRKIHEPGEPPLRVGVKDAKQGSGPFSHVTRPDDRRMPDFGDGPEAVVVEQRPRSFNDLRELQKERKRSRIRDVDHAISIDDNDPIDEARRLESNDTIMRALAAMDFDIEEDTKDDIDRAINKALRDVDAEDSDEDGQSDDDEVSIEDILVASGALDDTIGDFIEDDDAFTTDEGEGDGGATGDSDATESFLRSLMSDSDGEED